MARQYQHKTRGDVITVPKELEKRYDDDANWKRFTAAASSSSTSTSSSKK